MGGTDVMVTNEITEKKIIEYLDAQGMTKKLSNDEKIMFVRVAQEFGLNPFKREIHISVYGEGEKRNVSIITGYDVYIKRAERTGKLDGWKCWIDDDGNSMKAIIEIYRKDQSHPFQHEVYYSEAVQNKYDGTPNRTWAKMPRFMLKKVAIGQGFRLCFPDEMGGMPYEESEIQIPEEPKERNVTTGNDNSTGHESPPLLSTQAIEQQCQDAMTEIGTILKTIYEGNRLFTEEEIKQTREACIMTKGKSPEDRLFVITKYLNEKKKQMEDRIEWIDKPKPAETSLTQGFKDMLAQNRKEAEENPADAPSMFNRCPFNVQ
jgi:phage recombination protein Bet